MPGYFLVRRDLNLVDPKAGAFGMRGPSLDFVEMTRVFHRFHDALLESQRRSSQYTGAKQSGRLPRSLLRVPRNGQRLAGFEEGLETAQDLGPAFLHGFESGTALRKLVVSHGELAHQSHRLDLVGHARGLVLDEFRLEGMHQLLSRNHLDHDALHARAGPPVQLGPVHIVEPSPSLELGPQLEPHVVLTRGLGLRERLPKRTRRGADIDDVDQLGLEGTHGYRKSGERRDPGIPIFIRFSCTCRTLPPSCRFGTRGTFA